MIGLWLALLACGPKHDYPDGRGLTGQLEREVVALHQRVRQLEEQAATCDAGGPAGPVYTELVQIFQGSEVEVTRQGARTVLVIPTALLLGEDTKVRDESAKVLDLLGMALNLHPDQQILVEAHTSDRPLSQEQRHLAGDAWGLGYAQARSVQRELVYRYGVTEARFTVASRGALTPVASNDTPAGQRRNERVVLTLSPAAP